jgi:hypothetical protein
VVRRPSNPARRGRRPSQDCSAVALTALLCLAAQLFGFAHLVLVRHATCLEHAEMVHAPAATPAQAAAARERAAGPGVRGDLGSLESAGHEDDHCLVVASRRRDLAALGTDTASAVERPSDVSLVLPRVGEQPAPPVPLLSLAPKSSPPAPLA